MNERKTKVYDLPLPVITGEGTYVIVTIPAMSEAAFQFFLDRLENYRPAIVARETQSQQETAGTDSATTIEVGDEPDGD